MFYFGGLYSERVKSGQEVESDCWIAHLLVCGVFMLVIECQYLK